MKIIFKNSTKVTYTLLKNIAGNDDLRQVMKGACIDIINKALVVTDAHILISYPIEIIENDSEIDHKIVPLSLFNRLRYMGDFKTKVLKVLDVDYVLSEDYAEVFFKNELLYRCKYIDGLYPKYLNVMPKDEGKCSIEEIGINPIILARFLKGLPANKKEMQYKMMFFGANKAIKFEEQNCHPERPIIGIAMPTRLNQ